MFYVFDIGKLYIDLEDQLTGLNDVRVDVEEAFEILFNLWPDISRDYINHIVTFEDPLDQDRFSDAMVHAAKQLVWLFDCAGRVPDGTRVVRHFIEHKRFLFVYLVLV